MSQSNAPNAAFQKALQQYLALKPDSNNFGECSPEAILDEIQKQSDAYIKNHRMVRYLDRFKQIISPLEQFFSVLNQSASSLPSQLAFVGAVWGCLRFVVTVVTSFAKYFERIVEVLENITQNLRFYQDYATELYKASDHVQQALADVYAAILMVCREVKHTFRTKQNQDRSSTAILIRTLNPWNRTLDTLVQDLNKRQQLLKQETKHADRIFDHEDRKAQMDEARDKFLKDVPYAECYTKHGQSQQVLSSDLDAGRWLLEREEYKKWKSHAGGGLLWINGKPGAGKTILTSIVIEDLEKQRRSLGPVGKTGVGFFYCQHNDDSKRGTLNLLGTLIHHLLKQLTLDAPLIQILRGYSLTQIKTTRGLQELLTAISAQFDQVYIAIDALDECDLQSLPSVLQALWGLSHAVSVVATSRDKVEIRRAFATGAVITIDPLDIAEDIRQFVERRVYLDPEETDFGNPGGEMVLLVKDQTLRQEIVDVLLAGADGMFLWVDLQIAHLLQQSSEYEVRQALKSLPQGLEATFIRSLRVIEDLPSSRRARARRALRWIVFAQRPLSLAELVEAVAIDDMDDTWDATRIVSKPLALINDCACLVSRNTDPESWRRDDVQLVHASVKDFLLGSVPFPNDLLYYHFVPLHSIHAELTTNCFRYLRLVVVDHEQDPVEYKKHPFLDYIGYSCGWHIQSSESLTEGFFTQFNELVAFTKIREILARAHMNPETFHTLNILHMAALLDLPVFINIILRQHLVDISQCDSTGQTALHFAAYNGSVESAALLLDAGIDANVVDSRHQSPLHHAAYAWRGENLECLQLLLERGANVNAMDSGGSTPLFEAATSGDYQKMEVLLQHGADANVVDSLKQNVLHKSARSHSGNVEQLIQILLKYGFDPERAIKAADKSGCTPFHVAAQLGRVDFLQFCLGHGGDVYARTHDGQTLLHAAAGSYAHSTECLQILIDRLEVDCRDDRGWTPLCYAIQDGPMRTVNLLLERGAKFDVVDNDDQTMLHISAGGWRSTADCLEFLIGKGFEVDCVDKFGRTPLHSAATSGNKSNMEFLLQRGANPCHVDNAGATVLHKACGSDVDPQYLRILLDRLEVDCRDDGGWTPLCYAMQDGSMRTVNLLLERGAKLDVVDNDGQTMLHISAGGWRSTADCLEFLIGKGFEVDCVDKLGRTPLHSAATSGNKSNTEFLLQRGANPCHVDNAGATVLHKACGSDVDPEYLRILLDRLQVDCRDDGGWTPLCYAMQDGSMRTVNLLLERGAKLDVVDNDGQTMLHISAGGWGSTVDCLEFLIGKGFEVDCVDKLGRTPLHSTATSGNKSKMEFLLQRGANPHHVDNAGETVLHRACSSTTPRAAACVTFLLSEYNMDANIKAQNGRIPLHYALKVEVVQLLIDHGAEPNVRDNDGKTPLHCILALPRPRGFIPPDFWIVDSFALLVAKGAGINALDNDGKTPFDIVDEDRKHLVDRIKKRLGS